MTTVAARTYGIRQRHSYFSDTPLTPEEHVDFHVHVGDCFATYATIVGIVKDSLVTRQTSGNQTTLTLEIETLGELKKNLMYLHRKYTIVPTNNI